MSKYLPSTLHCFSCHAEAEHVYLNGGYFTLPDAWTIIDNACSDGRPAVFCSSKCLHEGSKRLGKTEDDITPVDKLFPRKV